MIQYIQWFTSIHKSLYARKKETKANLFYDLVETFTDICLVFDVVTT